MIERYFPRITATQYGIAIALLWMVTAAAGDIVVRLTFDVTFPVAVVVADCLLLVGTAWYHEHLTAQQSLPVDDEDLVRAAA